MAAIDKTYTSSWEEYQEVVNWAKEHNFTCPNGMVIEPIKRVYKWDKEDFRDPERKLPILNTSHTLDYFLIKYCPLRVVQDRMKEIYGIDEYNAIKTGISWFDTFVRPEAGTKVKMIQDSKYRNRKPFSAYSSLHNRKYVRVLVDVRYNSESLWYNEDYDTFLFPYELGIATCSCAVPKCKSIKAIIRKIRKWNLPKGCIVEVKGRYVGETWKFLIK